MERLVKTVDKRDIYSLKPVKVWFLGKNLVEVVSCDFKSSVLSNFRKLDKTSYIDLETGEILDYSLKDNRSQNLGSMRKTIHNIRRTINNNFFGGDNELFITLTYSKNMMDNKKLYNDFKRFWVDLKNLYSDKYSGLEYINVIEPQERGAWHCHVLIKCDEGQVLYIPNDVIYKLWSGKGFTKTKRLKGIDNIGAYLSAYLSDIEITKDNVLDVFSCGRDVVEKTISEDDGSVISKRFVKGGRLKFYGSMTNIFRCSRGIIKPASIEEPYENVKKITGSRTPCYSKSIAIFVDETLVNSITYENYNLKRT